MKKRHAASMGVLVLSTLIASCGGGGGGGGGGGFPGLALPPAGNTPPPASNPAGDWLTFNPSPVELTVFPNASKTFVVNATSTKVISAPVNVGILEPKGVITTDIKITSGGMKYAAILNTNPSLAPGVYTGNFEIRVCYDANPLVCSQPVEGSPWQLPYKITVIDPASLHYSRWEAAQRNPGFTDNFALSYVKGKLVVEAANYYDATMETWTSSDVGNTWVKLLPPTIPSVSTKGFALASDGDAIYLSAGQSVGSYGKPTGQYLNHVWKFDGTDWTQKTAAAEFPGRMDHVMAKVGNTLYVVAGRTAGGDVRNVWKSDNDGVNWTQVTQGLPTELGKPTCALNWKGSLLLVGDKVATSSDGATFTIASGLPATFPKNSLHCAVLNGRLFISPTSNSTISSAEQNVVSTTDLATWQIERPRSFSTPDAPGMVGIDGRLVVTTGQGTSERVTYRTVP